MGDSEGKINTMAKEKTDIIKHEILSGVAQYAFLHRADQGNLKRKILPAYKIDLMFNNEEQKNKAKALGLTIKPADDKHPMEYVTIKSKVKEGRKKPRLIDSQRNDIPESILVGNGSEVNVRFLPWGYGEGEVSAVLLEVQVVKLVEYKPTEGEKERKSYLPVIEGGFVIPNKEEAEVTA